MVQCFSNDYQYTSMYDLTCSGEGVYMIMSVHCHMMLRYIKVQSKKPITGAVVFQAAPARKLLVLLTCVSTRMPCQDSRAPPANGVDARQPKTNPSRGRRGKKNNGGTVLHSFKRLFITIASHVRFPSHISKGGNQAQAKLVYGSGCSKMAHHEVARRQS